MWFIYHWPQGLVVLYWPALCHVIRRNLQKGYCSKQIWVSLSLLSIFFLWNFTHVSKNRWGKIIIKRKQFYFSNMKKIIKHYPMTGRIIVTRVYKFLQAVWKCVVNFHLLIQDFFSVSSRWSDVYQVSILSRRHDNMNWFYFFCFPLFNWYLKKPVRARKAISRQTVRFNNWSLWDII